MDTFHYSFHAQEIVFGPGVLGQIGELTQRFGWQRILLCTTAHSRPRGHIASVERALGERLAATYEGVQPHVPESQVRQAAAMASEQRIDAIIGMGGGSAIGTAKAVSADLRAASNEERADADPPGARSHVAVIAIPTTYAGSEMTAVYGVTRQSNGLARKVTFTDPTAVARLVVYDPQLTVDLPPHVTAGTGINAAAHCIEALYSITRNPLSTAAALAGLRAASKALWRCYVAGDDLAARSEMLAGAFLAGTALSNVAMGLHHGICHVLGGTTGAAHGDVNAVMLPHVIRFNLDTTALQLAPAADAMGVSSAGMSVEQAAESVAQRIAKWTHEMGLPTRLREIGVPKDELSSLASLAFVSRTVQNNPKPITDVAVIEALLHQAW